MIMVFFLRNEILWVQSLFIFLRTKDNSVLVRSTGQIQYFIYCLHVGFTILLHQYFHIFLNQNQSQDFKLLLSLVPILLVIIKLQSHPPHHKFYQVVFSAAAIRYLEFHFKSRKCQISSQDLLLPSDIFHKHQFLSSFQRHTGIFFH